MSLPFARETTEIELFHAKLYGFNRIGRVDLIVLLLISLHQGDQHVQSIPHRGVRFRIPKVLDFLKRLSAVAFCLDRLIVMSNLLRLDSIPRRLINELVVRFCR